LSSQHWARALVLAAEAQRWAVVLQVASRSIAVDSP